MPVRMKVDVDVDVDVEPSDGVRGVHLVVEDIVEARAELVGDPDGNSFELREMAWRRGETY